MLMYRMSRETSLYGMLKAAWDLKSSQIDMHCLNPLFFFRLANRVKREGTAGRLTAIV